MQLESHLNEAQLAAVTHGDGPLLVIAGAGSGKTRVLTYRFVHLALERGVDPRAILAVTFTNKAAREMADRIYGMLGGIRGPLSIGTFHSFGARFLRIEYDLSRSFFLEAQTGTMQDGAPFANLDFKTRLGY